MNKNILLFTLSGLFCLFQVACDKQSADADLPATIIEKHVIRFTEPSARIPSKYSVYGPVLGNGYMGVALSGQPERQEFYLSRNDFWRLKSAHNEGYPAMLGKFEVSMPALEGSAYLAEQHLYDATTDMTFRKGDTTVSYRSFVAATEDVFVLEISMEGQGEIQGDFRLLLPGKDEIVESWIYDRSFPEEREDDYVDGTFYAVRAFQEAVDIPTRSAFALRKLGVKDTDSASNTFVVSAGHPAVFVLATSGNFKSHNPKQTAIDKARAACSASELAKLKQQHKRWWQDYWAKSWVSIPDSAIERQYYLSLYGIGSASRDPDFPPGIFGTWVTCEQPAWLGDYHLNYNHQAGFYQLYSGNRLEQAEPYYRPILALIERGKYYSGKIDGIPEGVLYPVGIGPVGIETTRWSQFMIDNSPGWRESENIRADGMFWGQKSNASYCVANMAMQFYRTWDEDFARRVYPFVKAAATFWEYYVTPEDGHYSIYNDAVHEQTVGDKNNTLSLGFVRQTLQLALDMSEFLNADADRREHWIEIRDHIADYPLMEREGKTIFRLTEKGLDYRPDNSLAIQQVYPGEQIGLDSPPLLLEIARNTLMTRNWLDDNANNSIFPAAVRLGINPDTILYHLNRFVENAAPNGFQYNNPHGIETWSTVPNTINEMLCMGHQDLVRLFPVWPRNKDARFHQIRVQGAFLVSAELKNGQVEHVSIFSEQGRKLRLLDPWTGEIREMPTEKGKTYHFNSPNN